MSDNMDEKIVTKENFDAEKFGNSIITWGALAELAQGNDKEKIVYFKLPGTITQCGREFDTMFLVKMPNGKIVSALIKIEDDGKPSFSIPGDVMREFVKAEEKSDGN